MENLGDAEFFTILATSLEATRQASSDFDEDIDEFPEQNGSIDHIPDGPFNIEEPLSPEEKEELIGGIQRLPRQYLRGMLNIINPFSQQPSNDDSEEPSPTLALRQLDSYVKRKTHMVFLIEDQPGQEQF